MKALSTALVLGLVTVACGKSADLGGGNDSALNGRGGPAKHALGDEVASVQGYISQVTHLMGQMGPDRPGYTKTFVTLEIGRGCFDKFATASHTVSYAEGKAIIDVAAFNYIDRRSIAAICTQEVKADKVTVELNGFFTESNITVNWLKDASVSLKKGDMGVYKISHVSVLEAFEMCPAIEGRPSCRAVGSIVKLSMALNGCVDRLANVVTKVEPLEGKKVRLTISALGMANEASRRVRCIVAPTASHQIQFGYPAADAASVQLNILK